MLVRLSNVVLEARDPAGLARFYGELTDLPVRADDPDWADVGDPSGVLLSVQRAPGHVAPRWPDPASSMQYHLDFHVDDVEATERKAVELGAVPLPWGSAEEEAQGIRPKGSRSESGFRVYADPAGHPFCLCWG